MLLIDEISKKSMELSKRLEEVKTREIECQQKEHELSSKETELKTNESHLISKQNTLNKQEIKLYWDEYNLHKKLFSDTHCKYEIIKIWGKDFWLDQINLMFELGNKFRKSKTDVKHDLDCYLVGIYICFEMFDEAYDALCIQAEYGSWLNESITINVLNKSGLSSRMRSILESRQWEKYDYRNILKKINELRIGL